MACRGLAWRDKARAFLNAEVDQRGGPPAGLQGKTAASPLRLRLWAPDGSHVGTGALLAGSPQDGRREAGQQGGPGSPVSRATKGA